MLIQTQMSQEISLNDKEDEILQNAQKILEELVNNLQNDSILYTTGYAERLEVSEIENVISVLDEINCSNDFTVVNDFDNPTSVEIKVIE